MSQLLIDYYKAIEDSSARMLDAAKSEDWDGVMRFEGACAVLIEQLRHRSRCEELDEQSRAEKSRIMLRILNNDAQIRYLAEPWLMHCEQRLDGQHQFLH
jgi:flagellar protein FliT